MKQLSNIQAGRSGTAGAPSVDIERRDFLKRSTATALAWAGLGAVRATPSLAADYPTQPIRVRFPRLELRPLLHNGTFQGEMKLGQSSAAHACQRIRHGS